MTTPGARSPRGGGVLPSAERAPATVCMPAEWEPHQRCLMAWPSRRELWGDRLTQAAEDYAQIATAIARYEPVLMLARAEDVQRARSRCGGDVQVLELELDDSWMRDTGPIFVREGNGLAGADFLFNGWGEKYVPYSADAKIARRVLEALGVPRRPSPLVLEGGAISVDGEGTLITTESVLCNSNRNPGLSRSEIERELERTLGARCVVWLGDGLAEDRDTDGHVDNICHFIGPGRVMAQVVPDPGAPNHSRCAENLQRLRRARDARGRPLEVVEMPHLTYLRDSVPSVVAPYLNFYLANGAVIVPVTGHENDAAALELIARALPGRDVVPVPGSALAHGGGGVHCITQQQPLSPTGTPA